MTFTCNLRQCDYDGGRETHQHVSVDGSRSTLHNHEFGAIDHHHPGGDGLAAVFGAASDDRWLAPDE